MPSPRICPGCKQVVAADRGYSFDDKLNMICRSCGSKIVEIDDHVSEIQVDDSVGEEQDEAL